MNKDSWPKTEDGTIDWEVVFEHPSRGLIPLITHAHGPKALRDGAIAITTMLHRRKTDEDLIKRYRSEIETLIPEGGDAVQLPELAEATIAILRRIKEERVHKAAEFVRLQHEAADATDKRDIGKRVRAREAAKKRALAVAEERAKQRRTMVIGGSVAATLALMIAGYFVFVPQQKDQLRQFLDQMEAAADGEPLETHVYGGRLAAQISEDRRAVTAYGVPEKACANAGWYFANRGTVVINDILPNKIAPNLLKQLCSTDPNGALFIWVAKN